jgi:hyperosmotically inducible periplasmic protein
MKLVSICRNLVGGIAGLSLAVGTLGLTGCSTVQGWTQSSHPQRTNAEYASDEALKGHVEAALKDAPVYKYPQVSVTVFRGEVALGGFVATQDQKQEAVRIAQRVDGVRQVHDETVITSNPNAPIVGQTNPQRQ